MGALGCIRRDTFGDQNGDLNTELDAFAVAHDTSFLQVVYAGMEIRVRAVISEDGEVRDGNGKTLAYIEANGEVGDPRMNYAGVVQAEQIIDHAEKVIGEFDPGRGYVKDAHGSIMAEISVLGTITNNAGQSIGKVQGFDRGKLPTLAAYFLIVDPVLVKAPLVV